MNQNQNQTRPSRSIALYLALILIFLAGFFYLSGRTRSTSDYTYAQFTKALEAGDVDSVTIRPNSEVPTGQVTAVLSDGRSRSFYDTDVNSVKEMLENDYSDVSVYVEDVQSNFPVLMTVISVAAVVIFMILFFVMMSRAPRFLPGGKNRRIYYYPLAH